MELITVRSLIESVAERWNRQYPPDTPPESWRYSVVEMGPKLAKGRKLAALDPETATAAEVNAIIGNDGWTTPPACDECGHTYSAVVRVGEEPDHDSNTAHLCIICVEKAMRLLANGKG